MGSPLPAASLPEYLSSCHHSSMLGYLSLRYQAATKLMSVYDEAEVPRALMGHLMGLLLCSQWKHLRRPLQRAVLVLKPLKKFSNQCVNLRHPRGNCWKVLHPFLSGAVWRLLGVYCVRADSDANRASRLPSGLSLRFHSEQSVTLLFICMGFYLCLLSKSQSLWMCFPPS